MLDSQTKKRIDDCRDILVGKITDPKSQVEQITIAMIYKFMDDMDIESEEYGGERQFFVGDYHKYSWSKIFSPKVDAYEMLNLYGEGIEKMSENPNLNPLFRSIFKDAYLPYRDPETLKLFLKTIDGFSYEHSEKLGDAYEYLLSVLGSQGGAGQFRTPRHIIDFIVDLVEPKKGDRILDPACGTSGFLISSYKRILERNTDNRLGDKLSSMEKKQLLNSIYGYDLDPNMVRLSLVNLFLHGFTEDELNVIEYDSLTSEDRWNEYFDVILANPPFMTPKGGIRPHNRFSIKSNRAEVLFVNYIMEHLTPKGRAGIVVPEGIIFQSGTAYKQLRKSLVDKYLIGVISLPSGVFNPYSGVKTSILILDRELSQKTDKIFFGKVENDGYDLGAQRREIDKNDLPKIKEGVLDYVQNLTNGIDEEHPNLSYVSKEEILNSSDVGLSFERYVKNENTNTDFDYVKLGDLCKIDWGNTSLTKKNYSQIGNYIGVSAAGPDGKIDFFEYEGGKVVISAIGANCGRVFYIKNRFTAIKNTIVLHDYSTRCIPEFLFYLFNKNIFPKRGGGQPFISKGDTINVQIPLPPLEIQKEIVEELEQYQKVIDGAKQVVYNYKPHIDIDESWERVKLNQIATMKYGLGESALEKGDYRFIRISDINSSGLLKYNDKKFINISKDDKQYILNEGDILMARTGATYGKCLYFEGNEKSVYAGYLIRITLDKNKILNRFFWYFTQSYLFEKQKEKLVTGGAQPQFNANTIKKLVVPIPPISIQQKLIDIVEGERQIVEGNKKLIEIYTQKIEDRINKIWGE